MSAPTPHTISYGYILVCPDGVQIHGRIEDAPMVYTHVFSSDATPLERKNMYHAVATAYREGDDYWVNYFAEAHIQAMREVCAQLTQFALSLGSMEKVYRLYGDAIVKWAEDEIRMDSERQAMIAAAREDLANYSAPTVADPPVANLARRNDNKPRRAWESPRWRPR